MANRQLTDEERSKLAEPLLKTIRAKLRRLSRGDDELLFALRRKITKELIYDERGKPMDRRKLKEQKRKEQNDLCAICNTALPKQNIHLHRIEAIFGYTPGNTVLVHANCHWDEQEAKGFK